MRWSTIRKRSLNRFRDRTHCKQCGDEIELHHEWTEDGCVDDPFCETCVDFTGVWRSRKDRLRRERKDHDFTVSG